MNNKVPKLGLTLVLLLFAYTASRANSPNPEDLTFKGGVLLYGALIPTFATMYISARRAYLAKSKFWLWASILAWPAGYIYTLLINRDDSLS